MAISSSIASPRKRTNETVRRSGVFHKLADLIALLPQSFEGFVRGGFPFISLRRQLGYSVVSGLDEILNNRARHENASKDEIPDRCNNPDDSNPFERKRGQIDSHKTPFPVHLAHTGYPF